MLRARKAMGFNPKSTPLYTIVDGRESASAGSVMLSLAWLQKVHALHSLYVEGQR